MKRLAPWILLGGSPPPERWWRADPWSGEKARRRCRCGAAVIARASSWSRCERGHVRRPVPAAPAAAVAPPPPPPAPTLPRYLAPLVADLRALQLDIQRRPPPSPRVVALAAAAYTRTIEQFPEHRDAIERALPVLKRRAQKIAEAKVA